MTVEKQMTEDYTAGKAGKCPNCGEELRTVSYGIYWSSITDASEVASHWTCNKCAASWTEYYKVTVDSMGDLKVAGYIPDDNETAQP